MKKNLLGIAASIILLGTAVSANAAYTITYDFRTQSLANQQTAQLTVSGYTLEVQAFTANHQTNTNPWTTTLLDSPKITWESSTGLGVSNSLAGSGELDTGIYSAPNGWQDFLSFKIIDLPTGATAKYKSITYYGLEVSEFSQARQSTLPGGVLQGAPNPLDGPRTVDQYGTASLEDYFLLPDNFYNGEYWLLAGPRLAGGSGDSFRVAELSIEIVPVPAAAWLLGTGIAGLAALKRKGRKQ